MNNKEVGRESGSWQSSGNTAGFVGKEKHCRVGE